MLGVLPFVEDPDLSVSAARALAQHLPPWNRRSDLKDRFNFGCQCEGCDLTEEEDLLETKMIKAYKEEKVKQGKLKDAAIMSFKSPDSAEGRVVVSEADVPAGQRYQDFWKEECVV